MSEVVCPSCGGSNPEGFRFCGHCGTALPSEVEGARPFEERKIVTALFADLAASTEMASRLDPEDLRAVLRPFFEAMAAEIQRFGGTVEKFIGDAIVAAFGVPVAHEDDPVRAVRAALAMQVRLGALSEELSEAAGADLAMRIGVNTGEVLAHGIGVDEGIFTGEAVNIAARFQALAAPGTVLVGQRTYRDARHAIEFRSLGEVTVKGVDRHLAIWEVVGEAATSATAAAGAALRAPMVGRDHELALLRSAFEDVARGGGVRLVMVIGPAGIGKSRLSHEFATAVGSAGARVVRGRCLPYGEGLTYWPMAEILKADAGILDSDPPEVILDKARAGIEPRFGSGDEAMGTTQVLLSSIGAPVGSDPLAGAEPAAAQRLISQAWRRYAESLAAEGPVAVMIEDIHWADPTLLDLIEAFSAEVSGPVLFLCMARPELLERRPGWGAADGRATAIVLSPLADKAGRALIGYLLDGEAPAEVVSPILRRSEGNPFFTGELLRMMTEGGLLARRDGRWVLTREIPSTLPDTVQGVIASRLDLLSAGEKQAIQDAAVVGRVFWQGALEALGSSDAEAAADGLIAKGLVLEREASAIEGQRELIFNHILTRDVAYDSIPRSRRAEAHEAVGAWVEERTRGRAEEFAEILAFHFDLAGDLPRTARYGMLAGSRKRRVFAAEEAIRWYDRALAAAEAAGAGDRLIGDIALARGEAHEQLGRFAEAKQDYELALGCAKSDDAVALEARALAALAHVCWLLDRYGEGQRILPEALERARASGASDLEARLLYTAGTIAFGRGAFNEALGYHQDALRTAGASGDAEGEALARHGLTETRYFLGPFEEGLDQGLRADEILRSLGQKPMVHHNEYMVAWLEWFLGRSDVAREKADAAVGGCLEVGNRRDEVMARNARLEIRLSSGDIGGALEDARLAVETATGIGVPRARMTWPAGSMHSPRRGPSHGWRRTWKRRGPSRTRWEATSSGG